MTNQSTRLLAMTPRERISFSQREIETLIPDERTRKALKREGVLKIGDTLSDILCPECQEHPLEVRTNAHGGRFGICSETGELVPVEDADRQTVRFETGKWMNLLRSKLKLTGHTGRIAGTDIWRIGEIIQGGRSILALFSSPEQSEQVARGIINPPMFSGYTNIVILTPFSVGDTNPSLHTSSVRILAVEDFIATKGGSINVDAAAFQKVVASIKAPVSAPATAQQSTDSSRLDYVSNGGSVVFKYRGMESPCDAGTQYAQTLIYAIERRRRDAEGWFTSTDAWANIVAVHGQQPELNLMEMADATKPPEDQAKSVDRHWASINKKLRKDFKLPNNEFLKKDRNRYRLM